MIVTSASTHVAITSTALQRSRVGSPPKGTGFQTFSCGSSVLWQMSVKISSPNQLFPSAKILVPGGKLLSSRDLLKGAVCERCSA